MLGPSTTQLFRNFASTLTFQPGDEIIVSAIDHEANTIVAPSNNSAKMYGGADIAADMADIDKFAFWNDVQRCETLLGALSSNLEVCKEIMNTEVVAKLASELEKVAGVLSKIS